MDFTLKQSEQEFPYSLGTQGILDAISRWDRNYNNVWDTTLINIATMLRNNLDKNLSDNEIIARTYKDIGILTYSIYHYLTNIQNISAPYIILYCPNYDKIPHLYRRKLSPSEERLEKLMVNIKKEISDKKNGDMEILFDMPIYSMIVGNNSKYPHMHLYDIINKLNVNIKNIKKIMTRRYMLISHTAMDFYLFKYLRNVKLLECFTGSIKVEKDLGYKVFKEQGIPFNDYTHLLFGDSTRIRPVVLRNKRREYIELAHRESWHLKTPAQIKSSIIRHDSLLSIVFNQVNF